MVFCCNCQLGSGFLRQLHRALEYMEREMGAGNVQKIVCGMARRG
jgi:hypothetical protein